MVTYFLYQIEYVGTDVAFSSDFLDVSGSDIFYEFLIGA